MKFTSPYTYTHRNGNTETFTKDSIQREARRTISGLKDFVCSRRVTPRV
jgi:hypothetical protein